MQTAEGAKKILCHCVETYVTVRPLHGVARKAVGVAYHALWISRPPTRVL